jgi:hypothetical protein
MNTTWVERLPLDMRQRVAAGGRRGNTLCQEEAGLRQPLAVFHADDNFCLPHASVRQALAEPVSTKGTGSAPQWQLGTPAMAAGWTDRVWTLQEVLRYRVPPWPPRQAV